MGSTIAAFLAGAAVTLGGVLAGTSDEPTPRTALVIDATAGRDDRQLVDSRLQQIDAHVRLPRSSEEADTDVRYFAAQGYRVIVAGPVSSAAARTTGASVVSAPDVTGALVAAAR